MGPFDHPPVPQCRARLPRRSRDGGGRQQRAYLGPGGLHAAARGDSEGAPSVMGLRARAIVLSAAAAESLLRLERSPDPASGSIARRVRSLRSILHADCLHGEVVKQDRIPKALKHKYGLENLFVEDLPSFWRLLYTIVGDRGERHLVVVEIPDQRAYGRGSASRGR